MAIFNSYVKLPEGTHLSSLPYAFDPSPVVPLRSGRGLHGVRVHDARVALEVLDTSTILMEDGGSLPVLSCFIMFYHVISL